MTNKLYTKYLSDNQLKVNYDLEPLTKHYTITKIVEERIAVSSHHEQLDFEEELIYMRSMVGEYDGNHYIVAKRNEGLTEFSIVEYL